MPAETVIAFLRRIWAYVRPYQTRMILGLLSGILFALMSGALLLVIKLVVNMTFGLVGPVSFADELAKAPAPLRWALDWLLPLLPELHVPSSQLGMLVVVLTIPTAMIVRAVFGYLNVYLTNWASLRAVADVRSQLFDHLQNLPVSFHTQAKTGDLISRVVSDTYVLYSLIGNSFTNMIRDPVTVLALLAVPLSQQPGLTLISLVTLPVCLVPISIYGRKVRRSARALQTHASELTSLMHETFTGNRIIKAYNLEATVLEQFRSTIRRFVGQTMRVIRAQEVPSQLSEFLGGLGVTLVFLYVILSKDRSMTPGDFVQFILGIVMMYQPIKALTRLHNQLEQARAASQRVFELLDTPQTIVDPPNPVPLKAAGAEIQLRDLDFAYGEKPVLQQINLTVKPGQMVALVGSSGSGKTTLANLLLRFYDPQRGSIRIGGTDLRQVRVKDLRQQVALVAQETILFNDTIRQNIAYGRPGASDAEIEAAARHASAHEFIMEKPQGYDTVVGEKGVSLSGGQRQRLAIARAILKDAPILILDEATSALDTESERAVQAALERLMQSRTTLCIAHRLSTVQRADVIVVLDQGRIVEQGTHAALLRSGGIYQRLYELQFLA